MSKVIECIPQMSMAQTIALWGNAIRILENSSKRSLHGSARNTLAEVQKDWERRRAGIPLQDGAFRWPDTDASGGDGRLTSDGWEREGVLKVMGYSVGKEMNLPRNLRERILSEIFRGSLPPVFSPSYLSEWDTPSSAARLKKMAETIAALTRNGKRRRDGRFESAVRAWERDLEFLYQEFYIGKFGFAWPQTTT